MELGISLDNRYRLRVFQKRVLEEYSDLWERERERE